MRRIANVTQWLASSALLAAGVAGCKGDEGRPIYPRPTQTIMDLAIAQPELSAWVALVKKAPGLETALRGDMAAFTVFAPNNTALATVTATNPVDISYILRYHIAPGTRTIASLRYEVDLKSIALDSVGTSTTIQVTGQTDTSVTLSNSLSPVKAKVVKGDIGQTTGSAPYVVTEAKNGILHVIDGVLKPPPRVAVVQTDGGPGEAGPGDTGPGDTGPGDAGPGDAGPGDTGPRDASPADTGPRPDALGMPDAAPAETGGTDAVGPDAVGLDVISLPDTGGGLPDALPGAG